MWHRDKGEVIRDSDELREWALYSTSIQGQRLNYSFGCFLVISKTFANDLTFFIKEVLNKHFSPVTDILPPDKKIYIYIYSPFYFYICINIYTYI